ncbi:MULTISPECIES: HNH endonuclease signature motif containing protein [unclassified Enterobacter cloacae complex]|uniref:HNH endonuclease signature motif containing protein n=1 Tax=unclassified Enterobacter cloacae complex TaxID=2757714 RepID=UPI001873502F|nr:MULTISPECIES: HNH endonuclease signature motif containing protein [unclassified Enterobacter cloacae complex]MBE4946315.1 HNH endonuclease [Enterobacter cloacae complex sp. P1B]MBE4968683.1 HNH endonuclease [Enterobacter cloacae complex sp. P11RS]
MESYDFELFSRFFTIDESSKTGLRWIAGPSRNVRAGQEAGGLLASGHYRVKLNRKSYKVHRIIWLLANRKWPSKFIDHIDGNPKNNSLSNLRDVSPQENQRNMRRAKGYCWHKGHSKWMASIRDGERQIFLGYFNSEKEARAAYLTAKISVHGQVPGFYKEELMEVISYGKS